MQKFYTLLFCLSFTTYSFAQMDYRGMADNANPLSYEIPMNYVEGSDYLAKHIIFKFKEGAENALDPPSQVTAYLQSIGSTVQLMFPQAKKPESKTDKFGRKLVDLTRIYEASYIANVPVKNVMAYLKLSGLVEYVQPKIIIKPFGEEKIQFVPNDPSLSSQWHINKINAPLAWDITTGSASVIVAIPDGGTNFSHTDLGNIAYNLADPIDGVDNDGDGWIDNYRGWNTGVNNNNPQYNVNHGVAVTGTASATVNNAINGTGISYNSPYLPIRISNASGSYVGAESGVFYAAEKGAKIINCSWGGTSPWPLIQDVTQYAVYNKGCYLVASAGNSNNSAPYWPAAYPWVTCVAGSNSADGKSSTSSFYDFVDITAPGEDIFTTSNATFANVGVGTSWAAPIVSGAAALIRTHFPSYTPEQVDALLKETSFNLYSLPANAIYADKLGRGRLDIGAALTSTPGPSVKMITRNWTDGNDNVFSPGESVSLSGNFINWLNISSPALRCTLSTVNPNIALLDSIVTIGSLANLAIFSNAANPFTFSISPSCPENTSVLFKLKFNDGSYTDKQFFSLEINPSYINVTQNNVHTSFANNGRIGFSDENSSYGLGVSTNGALQHLIASSFMLANSAVNVSDATYGPAIFPMTNDFVSVVPAQKLIPTEIADFDAYGSFNDNNAGANKLDVLSKYKIWAWDDVALQKFVIVEYTLVNTAATSLSNLFSGIYSRWYLPNAQFSATQQIATWDATRKMGYAYSPTPSGSHVGVKLLTNDPVSWYAFNNNGSGGSIQITNGFTEAEKYTAISNGVSRATSLAGDVSGLLGTGPLSINSGDSVKVAFAIILGDNLADIQTSADAAQLEYDKIYPIWTGAVSSDWNDANNWLPNIIPNSCAQDITIPLMSNQPSISGTDFTVGNIKAADGVIINIQNGHALNVCKNLFLGNGTGTSILGGRLELMGTSLQHIGGNLKSDLVSINNTAGATIESTASLSVDSGLELRNGNLSTNGNLTLLSDATGTAYINNFSTGYIGTISGNINVQRYNPIGITGYRQLGTPVQLPNINTLNGFSPTGVPGFVIPTPDCNPNYVAFNSPYGNWMQFVENATPQFNCHQSLFEVLTSGGMTNGRGYYLGVTGNSTLTFTGIANDGPINFGLTHTNTAVTNGWNIVSNPYPSPLQWEMVNVPAGVDAIGKIWQTSGAYQGTFMDLDPAAVGIQSVAIGQAFQVRVSTPGASVPFLVDNSDRTISPPNYLFAGNDTMTLTIDIMGNGFADISKIRFIDNSTTAYDNMFDSPKMLGNTNQPMVYSVWQGTNYSTNSLGNLNVVYAVPLGIKIGQAGTYTFVFSNMDQFPYSSFIYLEDMSNGTIQNLKLNDTYTFSHDSSVNETRFVLHFYPPMNTSVTNVSCTNKGSIHLSQSAPVTWEYQLHNAQNGLVAQGTFTDTTSIFNLEIGNYTLTLSEATSGYTSTEQINISGASQVSAQPTSSLTIAAVGEVIQFSANATNANTYHWNFGDQITSSLANPSHTYTTSGTYQVILSVSNASCISSTQFDITINDFSVVDEENLLNQEIKIWTMGNLIHLSFTKKWPGKSLFSLYDANGKNLLQKELSNAEGIINIDAGKLAVGIYTVRLEGKNNRIVRKIIKGME